ncbi:hypothetical protein [Frigoribacterium sp. CFBP 13707]|uniref:hypothetical protein n=1 Tax=Frigoribacterium sp. CFBP 13707 TaxID=2775313 RepID=UPI00178368E3|nr:hypothetical protein [Frigoribacterium sp. CFBP 13707]MBD8729362.1 hypothetical protein [Frigoribacterium sp. CFBP 13707]
MIISSAVLTAAATAVATTPPSPVPGATSAQATATLVAAIVAGFGALLAAAVGLLNASRNLAQARRDQWWQQFQWAIEQALSHDQDESDVGSAIMEQLVKRNEATPADNEIAVVVADLLTERELRERTLWRRITDAIPRRKKDEDND